VGLISKPVKGTARQEINMARIQIRYFGHAGVAAVAEQGWALPFTQIDAERRDEEAFDDIDYDDDARDYRMSDFLDDDDDTAIDEDDFEEWYFDNQRRMAERQEY
jgi:hypothetical protein